jgi:hypothetical protein
LGRYWSASAKWDRAIFSLPARSAIARASLLRLLVAYKTDFVIRIDRGTWVGHTTFCGVLTALPMAPGQRPHWLEGACYAQHGRIPINLLVVWRKGQDEPRIQQEHHHG